MSEIFNIFPTTIYADRVENHFEFKELYYDLYSKYDYVENERSNTVSEGQVDVDPLLHLEPTLYPLFGEIISHVKKYVLEILEYKDIFNYAITKSWISRARDNKEIPWHIHSTSHVSFVYFLNIPPNSHQTIFLNRENPNGLFLGSNSQNTVDDATMVKKYNDLNSRTFYINPQEGVVLLFPSNVSHGTKAIDENFNDERLAIVGDVNLILKEEFLHHSMGLIDEKYWMKFE